MTISVILWLSFHSIAVSITALFSACSQLWEGKNARPGPLFSICSQLWARSRKGGGIPSCNFVRARLDRCACSIPAPPRVSARMHSARHSIGRLSRGANRHPLHSSLQQEDCQAKKRAAGLSGSRGRLILNAAGFGSNPCAGLNRNHFLNQTPANPRNAAPLPRQAKSLIRLP